MQIDENRIELEIDYSELYIICYITDYKRLNALNSRFLCLFDTNFNRLTATLTKSTQPWTQIMDEDRNDIKRGRPLVDWSLNSEILGTRMTNVHSQHSRLEF